MDQNKFVFPKWIDELPTQEQPRARVRTIVRYVALLSDPEASIYNLSERLGFSRNTLNSCINQGRYDNGLPVPVIRNIESLIGAGVIERADMNPFVYGEQ